MRELSLHILDIAQNSIAAGATRIVISAEADSRENSLTLKITDNGKGMAKEFVDRIRDPFVTTRTTRRVGLGIPLLAAAAEACEGRLTIESEPGKGATVEVNFRLNHIDRAPMGDIVSTIVGMIAANPEISFRYEHTVDGKRFIFDTDEVKKQLEDVPINDPLVVQWIRDHMAEEISAVGAVK